MIFLLHTSSNLRINPLINFVTYSTIFKSTVRWRSYKIRRIQEMIWKDMCGYEGMEIIVYIVK